MGGGDDQFEKSEPATPKRRKDYREKGQVAKSKEISSVLILVGVLLYIYFAGDSIREEVSLIMRENFRLSSEMDLNVGAMYTLLALNSEFFLSLIWPLLLMVGVLTVVSYGLQTQWLLTVKPLMPDISRIDPLARFKQMFLSSRLFSETGINVLKLTVLTSVLSYVIYSKISDLPNLAYMSPLNGAAYIIEGMMEIILYTAIIFIFVAIIDYIYQWFNQEKQMKMSKQEVRDEMKETEGNPQQKSQMRVRMREISMNKMIDSVPTADVVVTNPTHLAVALRYKQGEDAAPLVVAKGRGFWAERIKIIAKDNDVEIVEDKMLARALYKSVKVGGEIPGDLFRAVAELLAYVYGLQRKAGKRPQTA